MSWYRDEYLKSEDWKNLRNAILIYQDHTCESCGEPAKDVHHLNYRDIWNVNPLDLMAICRKCHELIHEWLETKPKQLNGLKRSKRKFGVRLRAVMARQTDISPRGYMSFRLKWSAKAKNHYRMTVYRDLGKKTEIVVDNPSEKLSLDTA